MSVLSRDRREHVVAYLEERDGVGCYYCGREFTGIGRHRTIDHATPKSRGGSNGLMNLRLACFGCNHMKNDMTEEEFFESTGLKQSIASITNLRRKDWYRFADGFGLRVEGIGPFWHPFITWTGESLLCDACGLSVPSATMFCWAPCLKTPITLY